MEGRERELFKRAVRALPAQSSNKKVFKKAARIAVKRNLATSEPAAKDYLKKFEASAGILDGILKAHAEVLALAEAQQPASSNQAPPSAPEQTAPEPIMHGQGTNKRARAAADEAAVESVLAQSVNGNANSSGGQPRSEKEPGRKRVKPSAVSTKESDVDRTGRDASDAPQRAQPAQPAGPAAAKPPASKPKALGKAARAPLAPKAAADAAAPQMLDEEALMTWRDDAQRQDVKVGPFTTAEDKLLKEAIDAFAKDHLLPARDYSWFRDMSTLKKSEAKSRKAGLMKQIASVLPHRKFTAVWSRLFRLTHPGAAKGAWQEHEDKELRELFELYGTKWTKIGLELERLPEACRDRWRRIGGERIKGRWSDEDTNKLKAIIEDYQSTLGQPLPSSQDGAPGAASHAPERRKASHLRDGIDWEVIATRMGNRDSTQCMKKWYEQLRPNMKETGEWAKGEDTIMLKGLWDAKPRYECDVAWDELVPGRGECAARRRWHLMRGLVPKRRNLEMHQQILYLVALKSPKLLRDGTAKGIYAVDPAAANDAKQACRAKDEQLQNKVAVNIAEAAATL